MDRPAHEALSAREFEILPPKFLRPVYNAKRSSSIPCLQTTQCIVQIQSVAHLTLAEDQSDLDVAVLVLPANNLRPFQQRVFLADTEIDQDDQPDAGGPFVFYLVFGYSASRTQVKVSPADRKIEQKSLHVPSSPVSAGEYLQEEVSQSDHLLLNYDHKEIVIGGRRVCPPRLQGVSGGGVFYISRDTYQGPLVAIATQNRRNSRLIVGTRVKHFLALARKLKVTA